MGRAADMQGNPSCMYRLLQGWPGGYTTDYATAPGTPHIHMSWGGREHGLRFAHGGGRTKYARNNVRGSHASASRRIGGRVASGQNNASPGNLANSGVH